MSNYDPRTVEPDQKERHDRGYDTKYGTGYSARIDELLEGMEDCARSLRRPQRFYRPQDYPFLQRDKSPEYNPPEIKPPGYKPPVYKPRHLYIVE